MIRLNISTVAITTLITTLIVVIFLTACSGGSWSKDDERFVQTYTDILILREQYADTAQANPKVREMMQKNGYTEASFRARFEELTAKPEKFRQMLDSARARAQRIGMEKTSPANGQPNQKQP